MSSLKAWHGGAGGGRRKDSWFGSPFFSSDEGDVPVSQDDEETNALVRARVDWQETDSAHVFCADIPGVKKEEVKVHVEDGNILQISGERRKEKEDESDTCHRVERQRGSFVRRFRLPENANVEGIKYGEEEGVFTVIVPKKEVEGQEIRTT